MGIAASDKKNTISFILEIFNLGGHTVNEHIFVLNEQKVNRLVLILRLSPSVLFKSVLCALLVLFKDMQQVSQTHFLFERW